MRQTSRLWYKMPKNMGVAPRFDVWNEQYEPWQHMKRMGRLVGTGFYIPPEWYNHFRMFPPINHNFQQEKTLNPHNNSEPTQDDTDTLSSARRELREELARKSRLVASEGMRYYNIFWVRKPLDRMEKEYYDLQRKGVEHGTAIKKVLQSFYEELTVKKRVAAIQAEEAKLSGRFITMREATVVLGVLAQLHREQLTPHQISLLAAAQQRDTHDASGLTASLTRVRSSDVSTAEKSEDDAVSADALADVLSEDHTENTSHYQAEVQKSGGDSLRQLRNVAADQTGAWDWYSGASPAYDTSTEPKK